MKCGNCKSNHGSVTEVRACYAGKVLASVSAPVAPSTIAPEWDRHLELDLGITRNNTVGTSRSAIPSELLSKDRITDKQEAFLNKLLDERPMLRDVENLWPENIAKLSKKDATSKITEVMATPKETTKEKVDGGSLNLILEGVTDGYFALPCKTGNNDLDFWRIGSNKGTVNAANKGNRRVQRFLGGQGPIAIKRAEAIVVAELIAALSPEERSAAQLTFGREIGKCGVCGKPLTDERSRSLGIGPICEEGF